MSLMNTLAKVAIGVAAAKGAKALVQSRQGGATRTAGGGSIFGGEMSSNQYRQQGRGGIEDMLGGLLGGQAGAAGGAAGGLGGLLSQLGAQPSRSGASAGAAPGLDQILGGLAGKLGGSGSAGAGGLGGLMGALAGAAQSRGAAAPQANQPSFGDQLNQAIRTGRAPEVQPTADQEAAAGLLVTAMVTAMKADGEIDDAEKARLIDKLEDATAEEKQFIQKALSTNVDLQSLIRAIPQGMEMQTYAMSVMAIDLDSQAEAQYLDKLGRGLGLTKQMINSVHQQLGVPTLYA